MNSETVEPDQVWAMKEPKPLMARSGATHLLSCDLAIAAAVARLEHLSFLLRHAPQDTGVADQLLKLTGVYWSEAASHYEAYRQVSNCEGKA